MREITENYIDGQFCPSTGTENAPLFNPATEEQIGNVRLSAGRDVDTAVAAAKRAFPAFSNTSPGDRVLMLRRLAAAAADNADAIRKAIQEEYGAPAPFVDFTANHAGNAFLDMAAILETYAWTRNIGTTEVEMRPVGVAGAITPWNANVGFICSKLAVAVAAGTSIVIKPSEMSAMQTQVLAEALHGAGLPSGVFNIVNGSGADAGSALAAHPDIGKISFTGSTTTGQAVYRAAAATMKRVTLELGGKGAQIVLDDADLDVVVPNLLANGFINSGQACIAGTRILVPFRLLAEVEARLAAGLAEWPVGPAVDTASRIGPMVSRKQWDQVQSYIALGRIEGARVLVGGEGRPDGIERGWFVRPTLFTDVSNSMRIAREEIFGPVLSIIPYRDEEDAIRIANDTDYGLQNYVLGTNSDRLRRVARHLESGRVVINGAAHNPLAPFGGTKQSGVGREYGVFGLEAFLEPRALLI